MFQIFKTPVSTRDRCFLLGIGVSQELHGIDGQEDIAGDIHFIVAMILLTVIVLHAGAALRHHFILKDDTLRRMYSTRIQQSNQEP